MALDLKPPHPYDLLTRVIKEKGWDQPLHKISADISDPKVAELSYKMHKAFDMVRDIALEIYTAGEAGRAGDDAPILELRYTDYAALVAQYERERADVEYGIVTYG